MKFLHAADIHLDSALAGLRGRDGIPAHVARDCTRRAFANLIDLAVAEDVAFLVIAGDLYDADWKDFSTGLFFAGEMRRLARPCFLIRGNHDAASEISRSLSLPPNVELFSDRTAETKVLAACGVALHGRSFPRRAAPEDLSASYPPPTPGLLNIGVLHTSAEDPGEHETYAPCRVQSLALKGYDYWALGHIHQRRVLHEHPFVVFPGNLQGRHPNETGAKGATLVEARDGRIVSVAHRALDVLRWARIEVDLADAEGMAEVAARARAAFGAALPGADGRPLLCRVTLAGATALHAALLADPEATDAEIRNAALAVGDALHVERVRLETRPPARRDAAGDEAAAQLQAAFLRGLDDPALVERLLAEFRDLAARMPRPPGRAAPALPQSLDDLQALAPEAWQVVAQGLGQGA